MTRDELMAMDKDFLVDHLLAFRRGLVFWRDRYRASIGEAEFAAAMRRLQGDNDGVG